MSAMKRLRPTMYKIQNSFQLLDKLGIKTSYPSKQKAIDAISKALNDNKIEFNFDEQNLTFHPKGHSEIKIVQA